MSEFWSAAAGALPWVLVWAFILIAVHWPSESDLRQRREQKIRLVEAETALATARRDLTNARRNSKES